MQVVLQPVQLGGAADAGTGPEDEGAHGGADVRAAQRGELCSESVPAVPAPAPSVQRSIVPSSIRASHMIRIPTSGCSRDMLSHSTCTVRVARADREIFARSRVRRQYGVLEHRGRWPRARREPRRPAHAGRRHGHLCAIAAFGAQAEDHDVRDAAEERCQRMSVVRMNTRVAHLSTCTLLRTLVLTLKNIILPVFYSIISTN